MPWSLINDNLEIDHDLITCAEYQLFLEETRESRQPLHWEGKRFLPGTAKQAITGVQAEDAVAFCKWLNQQPGNYRYHYRLPHITEADQYPLELSVGYWCTQNDQYLVAGIKQEQWQVWQTKHCQAIEIQCATELLEALIFLLESISDADINTVLIIDRLLLRAQKQKQSHAKIRARNHSLGRIREQISYLGQDLAEELENVWQFKQFLDNQLGFEQNQAFTQLRSLAGQVERNLVLDSDIVLNFDLVRDLDLGFKGQLTLELDFAQYMASRREKLLAQTRNFAKLLTSELVYDLSKCLVNSYDFPQAVHKTQTLNWKRLHKLVKELEAVLLLNRSQNNTNQPQQKQMDLVLKCLQYLASYPQIELLSSRLLLLAGYWHWLSQANYTASDLSTRQIKYLQQEYLHTQEEALSYYSALVLLKQRKLGQIPAWEGIRLVREQD